MALRTSANGVIFRALLMTAVMLSVSLLTDADNVLEVYNTLNHSERRVQLARTLYPDSIRMKLVCQRQGNRNVYWEEVTEGVAAHVLLSIGIRPLTGVRSAVVYSDQTTEPDNQREFMCVMEDFDWKQRVDFGLAVGENSIKTKSVDGVLSCASRRLSQLMKLCWIDPDDGQRLNCTNGNAKGETSAQLIWSKGEYEEKLLSREGKNFICRSQVKDSTKTKKSSAYDTKRFDALRRMHSKIINLRKEVRNLTDCDFTEPLPSRTFITINDDDPETCVIVTATDVDPDEIEEVIPEDNPGDVSPVSPTTKEPSSIKASNTKTNIFNHTTVPKDQSITQESSKNSPKLLTKKSSTNLSTNEEEDSDAISGTFTVLKGILVECLTSIILVLILLVAVLMCKILPNYLTSKQPPAAYIRKEETHQTNTSDSGFGTENEALVI